MALISTLKDIFGGSTLNSLWASISGSQSIAGNQCVMPITGSYAGIASASSYDCTNGQITVQCTQDAGVVLAQMEQGVYLSSTQADTGSPNSIQIGCFDGLLQGLVKVAGSGTFFGSATYVPATMAYLRIRLSGTTVFFDYSADGRNWTNLTSTTIGFAVTALFAGLFVGYDAVEAAANAQFANVNVTSQGLMMGSIQAA